jgi:hypothetical protein
MEWLAATVGKKCGNQCICPLANSDQTARNRPVSRQTVFLVGSPLDMYYANKENFAYVVGFIRQYISCLNQTCNIAINFFECKALTAVTDIPTKAKRKITALPPSAMDSH